MQDAFGGPNSILSVIIHLHAAIANTRLYTSGHPQVTRYLEGAHAELARLLGKRSELTLLNLDQELVVDQQPLTPKTAHSVQFAQLLRRAGVEHISFLPGVTLAELTQLASELAADDQRGVRSTEAIKVGKVEVLVVPTDDQIISAETQARIENMEMIRERSMDHFKELYHLIRSNKQAPVLGLEEIVQAFIRGIGNNLPPLQVLATLKSSDEYTFTHAVNVCILTMAQAEALGISGRPLYDIGIAASLHDAGKVFVPEDILNKPGKLTEQEWAYMRNHTIRGARQILRMDGLPKLAFLGALEHHIRYDGTGYPALSNWRPNVISQMIAIADMFDAMRTRRPYQAPKPDAQIIDILRKDSGTMFNPVLVKNFVRLIRR
ncbi:MAG: HD domain-containing protein [Desulfobacteraceae bacterium]|nr:HD domain-containing protein [Desulfobacteraceae bacterium]